MESALYDSQSNGFAESVVKDAKDRENEFGLSRQTLWARVPRRTPSPELACEVFRGCGEQVQKRSRWQDSLRAAKGAQIRASTAAFLRRKSSSWSLESRKVSQKTNQDGRTESSLSDRSDELCVGPEKSMHKVRTARRREATERVDLMFLNSVSARPWEGPKKVRDV